MTPITPERLGELIAAKEFEIRCDHGGADEVAGINDTRRQIIAALLELQSSREELTRLRSLEAAVREAGEALEAGAIHLEAEAITKRAAKPHEKLPKGEFRAQLRLAKGAATTNDGHAVTLRRLREMVK